MWARPEEPASGLEQTVVLEDTVTQHDIALFAGRVLEGCRRQGWRLLPEPRCVSLGTHSYSETDQAGFFHLRASLEARRSIVTPMDEPTPGS